MSLLNRKEKRTELIIPKEFIKEIKQEYYEPALINNNSYSYCIKCDKPKCITYSPTEIGEELNLEFSFDRNLNVCPTNAIEWDFNKEMPTINNKKCLKCGLCVNRCPVGAIYIKDKVIINEGSNDNIYEYSSDNLQKQKQFLLQLPKYNKRIIKENYSEIQKIITELSKQDGRTNIPNVITRNILISLGCNCAISRPGDVHTRIDAIYKQKKAMGPIEIEFGKDTLEAARALLDDIANLDSKGIILQSKDNPLVVCLEMPNKRQGYYQVIKDIKKVLGIKIQTITIGSLLILLWNDIKLDLSSDVFYVDFDNLSIRDEITKLIKRNIYIKQNEKGIFEPEK